MTQTPKNPFMLILLSLFAVVAFVLGCGGGGGGNTSSTSTTTTTPTTTPTTENLNFTFINKGSEEGVFNIEVRINGSVTAGDTYNPIIAKDGVFQRTLANVDTTASISFDIEERVESPTVAFFDVGFTVNLANRPNIEVDITQVNVNPPAAPATP